MRPNFKLFDIDNVVGDVLLSLDIMQNCESKLVFNGKTLKLDDVIDQTK